MQPKDGCNPRGHRRGSKLVLLQNGGGVTATEYPESRPAATSSARRSSATPAPPAAITVGAVQAGVTNQPEPYSSRGPVTHYFGPVDGTAPAPPLSQTISKPEHGRHRLRPHDLLRADEPPAIFRFCGTSAAAPHAAAVAALARQANPALTPAQIGDGLAATARPVGRLRPRRGRRRAGRRPRLLEDVALPPVVTIVNPPQPISSNRSPSIGFSRQPPGVVLLLARRRRAACPAPRPSRRPTRSRDGTHGFAVRGEDLAGKVGVSRTVSFVVDTVAPRTSFTRKPRHDAAHPQAPGPGGLRLPLQRAGLDLHLQDRRRPRPLLPAAPGQALRAGRHVLRAMAVDAAGNVDKTPAIFRFRVKRVGRRSRR